MHSDDNKQATESIESKRQDAHCCLCEAEGFHIALTDGRVIHDGCYEKLKGKESDLQSRGDVCSYQINTFSNELSALQEERHSAPLASYHLTLYPTS
jgi:hypothetical protein